MKTQVDKWLPGNLEEREKKSQASKRHNGN